LNLSPAKSDISSIDLYIIKDRRFSIAVEKDIISLTIISEEKKVGAG
jgi:hypothetical protein